MKSNYSSMLKKASGLIFAVAILVFSSCTDGYKDDWEFTSDVRNSQLQSPDPSKITVTSVTNATGGQELKITWPVVHGAGGYQFSFYNVDDPENPVAVGIENELVDGCSVLRERAEDTKYKIIIKTLGNTELNNTGATAATETQYTTFIASVATIPSGSDLAEYFTQNPIQGGDSIEQVYELEPNGNYTINQNLDFGSKWITLRGDKVNHSTVTIGEEGRITIMNGFKSRFIDFDCSAMTAIGVVTMSDTPDEDMKIYDANRYIILNPIVFQSSSFKGINQSLFDGNNKAYVIKDFQILDCIVQINNSAKETPVINCQKNGYNCIKDLIVMNSTFYNLQANNKTYFIRYGNASNAQPQKLGFGDNKASVNLTNNTFYQVMSNKDFANNMASQSGVTTTLMNNIFYDSFRINKIVGGSNQKVFDKETNFLFAILNTLDSTDKGTYGTEEDPKFIGPVDADPDAINFTPTSSKVLGKSSGDPRWLP